MSVIFAARIGHVGGRIGHLLDARNDLAPDRAIGIERIDQVEEVGRDAHGQLGVGQEHPGMFLARELDLALELRERFHAVAHLPLPVVPLFRRGFGPVALSG